MYKGNIKVFREKDIYYKKKSLNLNEIFSAVMKDRYFFLKIFHEKCMGYFEYT